jgi:hypothetical protein
MARVRFLEKQDDFLRAQNCTDLLPKLRHYGFGVYTNETIITQCMKLPAVRLISMLYRCKEV